MLVPDREALAVRDAAGGRRARPGRREQRERGAASGERRPGPGAEQRPGRASRERHPGPGAEQRPAPGAEQRPGRASGERRPGPAGERRPGSASGRHGASGQRGRARSGSEASARRPAEPGHRGSDRGDRSDRGGQGNHGGRTDSRRADSRPPRSRARGRGAEPVRDAMPGMRPTGADGRAGSPGQRASASRRREAGGGAGATGQRRPGRSEAGSARGSAARRPGRSEAGDRGSAQRRIGSPAARAASDEPAVPAEISDEQLDPLAREELRTLPGDLARSVGRRLVAAGTADDPEVAYRHALAARRLAARVGVVRETCGVAAYHAGRWAEALAELRAARRITGRASYLPLMADAERALGRLDRALEIVSGPEARRADRGTQIELRIVESGIRRDQGLPGAAVAVLQPLAEAAGGKAARSARLSYAYADALLDAGRTEEARDWFARAAAEDPEGETDAADRL